MGFLSAALLVSAAAAVGAESCPGDCDGDSRVAVNELVQGVHIALGSAALDGCRALDRNGDGEVAVNELVAAVSAALDGCPAGPTPTETIAASPTPSPSPDPQLPPASRTALTEWLRAGPYTRWTAESGVHESLVHGRVRTYLNDAILGSLQDGLPSHPRGAAVVKELYDAGDRRVSGWAVMIKLDDDSAGGRGWYWYENIDGSIVAAGSGVPVCTGCHASNYRGLTSRDFLLTPYPLR